MMARRILLTADAPQLRSASAARCSSSTSPCCMGDPRLPDDVKRGGTFNPEDHDTIRR